jgi:phenylalanyl-tRNA synthetase alpha chain
MFHQIEGFYVDQNASFAELKATLDYFFKAFFGSATKLRLRPSYFPFTEPSVEVDISCLLCNGLGCSLCKHAGWLEIGGAGMVHPQVLSSGGVDPNFYSGFAFGMGIERMAMLRYGIKDIRCFTANHIDFLKQASPFL